MKIITAYIVDDDDIGLLAAEMNLTRYCPEIKIIGKFKHPNEALEAANVNLPQVVFLDIRMEEMSGLELAKKFNQMKAYVIFISSYNEFALPALKISAVDFLTKPINPQELISSVRRVKSLIISSSEKLQFAIEEVNHVSNSSKVIALPTIAEITIANVNSIVYCKGLGNYTKVFFEHESAVVLSKTISLIEGQLDSFRFVRIHSKYLVNIDFISKMLRKAGSGILVMEDGTSLPISKSRRKHFLSKIRVL